MPILLKMNLHCNFTCAYCYENPIKPGFFEEIDHDNIEKIIREQFEEEKRRGNTRPSITLHGGEPTLYPKKYLRKYLALSHELTGKSGIQTNGYLIDDEMIEMFKAYDTGVGISVDGPWPLNELRGFGTREERIKQTAQTLRNLYKLKEEGCRVSIIAVMHKHNAVGERREMLKQWVRDLHSKGITGRLNPCCSGNPDIDLTSTEAVETYTDMLDFLTEEGISGFSPFKDIVHSLQGKSEVVCVFRDCDPFCTPAAHTILKDGSSGVCLRLYIDEHGKKYLRDKKKYSVRSDILKQTDCKDCKWWEHCWGGCAGMSVDWDWRNKDRYCMVYKALFTKISNMYSALRVDPSCMAPSGSRQRGRGPLRPGDHWDDVEHVDGDNRHLDSDNPAPPITEEGHSDGILHNDGDNIHQDGIRHDDSHGDSI